MMIAWFFWLPMLQKYLRRSVHLIWGFGYNNSGSSFGKKERFSGGSHRVVGCGYCNGYQHFAPVTFVVKGFEGFVAGLVVHVLSKRFKEKYHVTFLIASIAEVSSWY